ncbi:MAG: MarR family winged helix-turn-helix transcriptional regulator [Acidimicrobiales bacterium]
MARPLAFDPIEEAARQWDGQGWAEGRAMQAATSIMRAQQIVLARVDEALRPWSLTFARYEVLVLLHFTKAGALPLGKMGDRLMLHQASITNLVDRLEHQGLVRRAAHPTDRRTTLAELTKEGRTAVKAATKAVVGASLGVSELTERDHRDLHRILRKLRAGAADFDSSGPRSAAEGGGQGAQSSSGA